MYIWDTTTEVWDTTSVYWDLVDRVNYISTVVGGDNKYVSNSSTLNNAITSGLSGGRVISSVSNKSTTSGVSSGATTSNL